MKVKLYHKFVDAARKHALKRKLARKWLLDERHMTISLYAIQQRQSLMTIEYIQMTIVWWR